jgi:Protein of unknown function (DUF3224)
MIARDRRHDMKGRIWLAGLALAGLALGTDTRGGAPPARREMTMTARGTFDVKVTPQPQDDSAAGPFGRLFLDKQFAGDLQGSGKGQMLASGTGREQSGAYVALELVTGTLHGKRGSFVLQHKGTMSKGAATMEVTVVPDSGTEALAGIGGAMTILVEGRQHSYVFTYSLDPTP